MTRISDREALKLALERYPGARDGKAAAYSLQMDNLKLKPWENPPMYGDVSNADAKARRLLKRMLDAGVSRYHPDPLAAIEAAK